MNYTDSIQIRNAIEHANHVLIAVDANVDLDVFASSVALAGIASRLGTTCSVICSNELPEIYKGVYGADIVKVASTFADIERHIGTIDLIVVTDIGSLSQLGELYTHEAGRFESTPVVCLDHHVDNSIKYQLGILDPTAAANCEIVALVCEDLHYDLEEQVSTLLLGGIVADTRSYATSNVTPRTFRVAAWLTGQGGDVIYASRLAKAHSLQQLHLWGKSLAELSTICDGMVVCAIVTRKMLEEVGDSIGSTSGLVNLVDDMVDLSVSVLIREMPDGQIRISFRSHRKVDVNKVATRLGGGGHKYAAACRLNGVTVDQAKQIVENELRPLLK